MRMLNKTFSVLLPFVALMVFAGCRSPGSASPASSSADAARPRLSVTPAALQSGTGTASRPASNVLVRPAQQAGEVQLATQDNSQAAYRLKQGDPVLIYLRGILPRDDEVQTVVDERGNVTLPYIDAVRALGKTAFELQRDIQKTYIDREIYRTITINVIVPSQSFFVQGEVRAPQRYPLITGMTLMQAIASAGGYSEFADRRRVQLTRGDTVRSINMRDIERDPKLDIMIESGDVIRVPRSIF